MTIEWMPIDNIVIKRDCDHSGNSIETRLCPDGTDSSSHYTRDKAGICIWNSLSGPDGTEIHSAAIKNIS